MKRVTWKKVWHFLWEDDSILSWIANITLAFILIKFIVYPGLGFALGTSHPVVAVVSSSMHHQGNFNAWWSNSQEWYENNGISQDEFREFPLRNGFNKGDIIVLRKASKENIDIGDVIVFQTLKPEPIIHRVVTIYQEGGQTFFQTKGDNYETNKQPIKDPLIDETRIAESQVIGKAAFKIPFLGYIKIVFVDYIAKPYCNVTNNFFPCRS